MVALGILVGFVAISMFLPLFDLTATAGAQDMITFAKSTQVSSIGLDVDQHEFRAVQLVRSNGTIRVQSWAVFPRQHVSTDASSVPNVMPDDQELLWAKSILDRRGFWGHDISVAPDSDTCSSHNFELPPLDSGAPLDQLARMEVARDRRCPPEAFEFGHWSMPGRGRSKENLAVACPREGHRSDDRKLFPC